MRKHPEPSSPSPGKIFLLSPASLNGERAKYLLSPTGRSETARQIRSPEGAPLEEVFTFVSSLYFRGKMAYVRRFAAPPPGFPAGGSALVIAPGFGLVPPDWRIDRARAEVLRGTPVDLECPEYVEPMRQHLRTLRENPRFLGLWHATCSKRETGSTPPGKCSSHSAEPVGVGSEGKTRFEIPRR